MFERYTQKAMRVILFAQREASRYGSREITTEHLLRGLLRGEASLLKYVLGGDRSESIRNLVEERAPIAQGYVSTSGDMPISQPCKKVLLGAAKEADHLKDKRIGTEHLLLGLLGERKCLASQILGEMGLEYSAAREKIAQAPEPRRSQWLQSSEIQSSEDILSKVYPQARQVPEDIPSNLGARWGAGYLRKAESIGRLFHWEKRVCKPRDALRHRKNQRLCLYNGESFDAAEFELVQEGWAYDYCVVCWRDLYQPNHPHYSFGYTNGQEWLCAKCYEVFVGREGESS